MAIAASRDNPVQAVHLVFQEYLGRAAIAASRASVVLQEPRDFLESLASLVHLDFLGLLDLAVSQVPVEHQVLVARLGFLAFRGIAVLAASLVILEQAASLDCRENQGKVVSQGPAVYLVQVAIQASRVKMDRPRPAALVVTLVSPASPERVEPREPAAFQPLAEILASQDSLERAGPLVSVAIQVFQEQAEPRDIQGAVAHLEQVDIPEYQENPVQAVLLGPQDSQGLLALVDTVGSQDRVGLRAILASAEPRAKAVSPDNQVLPGPVAIQVHQVLAANRVLPALAESLASPVIQASQVRVVILEYPVKAERQGAAVRPELVASAGLLGLRVFLEYPALAVHPVILVSRELPASPVLPESLDFQVILVTLGQAEHLASPGLVGPQGSLVLLDLVEHRDRADIQESPERAEHLAIPEQVASREQAVLQDQADRLVLAALQAYLANRE